MPVLCFLFLDLATSTGGNHPMRMLSAHEAAATVQPVGLPCVLRSDIDLGM